MNSPQVSTSNLRAVMVEEGKDSGKGGGRGCGGDSGVEVGVKGCCVAGWW